MAETLVLKSDNDVAQIAFTKDGKSLAAFSSAGIQIWNLASKSVVKTIAREKGESEPTFLDARGQYSVVGREGAKIRDLESGAVIRSLAITGPRAARVISTMDGGALAAGSRDDASTSANLMRVWDAGGKQRFQVPAGIGGLSAMVFSPDGEWLVAAAYDTDVRVWNARNGELAKVVGEMTVSMFDLAFSPDGTMLAAAGVDRTVYLWDAKNWKLLRTITGQPEMISALEFSPDGKRLVTGGMNELAFGAPVKVIVWDVASGKALRTEQAEHRVATVAFSPDGKWFAAADRSRNIKLWAM
ncbi:MAG: hypothetical protein U0Q16_24695 [Bryobacteraceae bacterium]